VKLEFQERFFLVPWLSLNKFEDLRFKVNMGTLSAGVTYGLPVQFRWTSHLCHLKYRMLPGSASENFFFFNLNFVCHRSEGSERFSVLYVNIQRMSAEK
jgi:hypothetical protein